MRVVAALSGGVDSSVAAQLLAARGHQVIGLFMRLASSGGSCCNLRTGAAARRVADRLGIPFIAVDYEEEFGRAVVRPALADLAAGLTPNPCVSCNGDLKFGPLLERARRMGAAALVTGHYARISRGPQGAELHEARDKDKDQSYFLWPVRRGALARLSFPLGSAPSKAAVRRRARQAGLPTSETPESQDLCFAPDGLAALLPDSPGEVVGPDGEVVGRHHGHHTVTLGQRRGLGVALGSPHYAVGKDPATNTVTVAPARPVGSRRVDLAQANWLAPPPGESAGLEARVRHRGVRLPVERADDGAIEFSERVAVAPGQSVVVYRGTRVLGGGVAA